MADSVILTIDGQEVLVPEGITILQAAAAAGIAIPHLCYCPGLKGTGACRLCVVEIENVRGLVVSCMRKVSPGMVVRTDTEQIREARRFVIELLLSRHPGLCLSCEKSGACKLQQYAYELGIERPSFPVRDPGYPVDEENPFIIRNYNLCILCGRCVRVCRTQGNDVLDFMRRGIETKVATPLEKPLLEAGCDFCGSCVGVCPTGALIEKQRRRKGREWEFSKAESYCGYCGSACRLYLNLKRNEIVKVSTAAPADYLCVRGRFGYGYLTSKARLTTPLIRRNGELREVDWAEALDLVGARFRQLREKYGPDAIGGIVGGTVTNEVAFAFYKFFREGLGTANVDSGVRFTGLAVLQQLDRMVGGPDGYASLADIENAKVILVLGDVWRRVPAVWGQIKRAADNKAQIIYLGFYKGRPTRVAKVWLRAFPGTEHLVLQQLAGAVLARLGEERSRIEVLPNFGAFATGLAAAEGRPTGVGPEEIATAAEIWADTGQKGVVVLAVDGITEDTARAVWNLSLLTGRTAKALFLGHSLLNAHGVWRMGAVAAKDGVIGESGMITAAVLAEDSPLRGLYVLGEDPVASFPGCGKVRARLERLEFLVVQDLFLTETARMADVVLPLATHIETGGTVWNVEGKLRQGKQVLPAKIPVPVQVFAELASKIALDAGCDFDVQLTGGKAAGADVGKGHSCSAPCPEFLPVTAEVEARQEGELWLVPLASRFGFYDYSRVAHTDLRQLSYRDDGVALSLTDAERLQLVEGTRVNITSFYGATTGVVRIDAALMPGVVTMPAFAAQTNILLPPGVACGAVKVEIRKSQEEA
ncbi:molybdopterin-dependent oxidoreductase [Thermodesulfitimonas sp.]